MPAAAGAARAAGHPCGGPYGATADGDSAAGNISPDVHGERHRGRQPEKRELRDDLLQSQHDLRDRADVHGAVREQDVRRAGAQPVRRGAAGDACGLGHR